MSPQGRVRRLITRPTPAQRFMIWNSASYIGILHDRAPLLLHDITPSRSAPDRAKGLPPSLRAELLSARQSVRYYGMEQGHCHSKSLCERHCPAP